MNERTEKILESILESIRVNEQIERLAKQAGCTIDRLGYGEGNLEKFAELIVQECIDVHEDHYGVDIIGDVLKEHFGVKE